VSPVLVEWLERNFPLTLSPAWRGEGAAINYTIDQAEQRGRQQVIDYLRTLSNLTLGGSAPCVSPSPKTPKPGAQPAAPPAAQGADSLLLGPTSNDDDEQLRQAGLLGRLALRVGRYGGGRGR
jgi:hypothetical protein